MNDDDCWMEAIFYAKVTSWKVRLAKLFSFESPYVSHVNIRYHFEKPCAGDLQYEVCITDTGVRIMSPRAAMRHMGDVLYVMPIGRMTLKECSQAIDDISKTPLSSVWHQIGWYLGIRRKPPVTCATLVHRVALKIRPDLHKEHLVWPSELMDELWRYT